jgi:DNA-binding MarR family transcriptional regulator
MSRSRQEVSDRLHSASLHLIRVVRAVDADMGLSPARASVMSILVFGGPRTVGGLAVAEGVRSPTMTSILNGLEADGLVRRARDRHDARQIVVHATPKGRRVLQQGRSRRVERLESLLGSLDRSDLALLDRAADLIELAMASDLTSATGG